MKNQKTTHSRKQNDQNVTRKMYGIVAFLKKESTMLFKQKLVYIKLSCMLLLFLIFTNLKRRTINMKNQKTTHNKKLTMIGMTLFLLVTSVWAGTLRDNFDDGNADGWRTFKGRANNALIDQSAQWVVENGELVSTSKNVCTWSSIFGIGDNTWKDYEFEFQFRIENVFPAGCGAVRPLVGFGVHFDNPDEFIINGLDVVVLERNGVFDGVICERFFRGGYTSVGKVGNISIEQGEWHTARTVVKGNRYQMFINNQLLCDTKYDLPDAGAIGLMEKNCAVHFDNIVVTGDDIPDRNLAISQKNQLSTTWGQIRSHQ